MNRRQTLAEAMGLGPLWLPRGVELQPDAYEYEAPATTAESSVPTPSETQALPVPATPIPELAAAKQADTPPLTLPAPESPLSWEELQKAVAICQRCRLCETRTQTVFGRGSAKARLLVVGEAPGENEDKQGEAFVGRAGQLLDNMFEAIGLDSNVDVFITNVLKCRPPGNRNPSGDEIIACQDYLLQQIAHLQPTLILALGRFAAQTLLCTDQSISRLRGQLHSYRDIPLIVSFHPAYLLRNLPDKAKAWQDLVLTKRTFEALQGKPN
jgi:DNA polymerase